VRNEDAAVSQAQVDAIVALLDALRPIARRALTGAINRGGNRPGVET